MKKFFNKIGNFFKELFHCKKATKTSKKSK